MTRLLLLVWAVIAPSSHAQDFTLGEPRVLPELLPALPIYDYAPDAPKKKKRRPSQQRISNPPSPA